MKDAGNLSFEEAKRKATHYCAYQERSIKEVKSKLESYGLSQDQIEDLLKELIKESFIDEERFAQSYARGKFNRNKWGKVKIKQGLQQKGISEKIIQVGLSQIDSNTYHNMIEELIRKKGKVLESEDEFTKKHKIAQYTISKGFEVNLVWEILGEVNS